MTENMTMEKEVFVFPVSFAQQRLWFLDQLEPGGSAYNMGAVFRLAGPLQAAALEQTLNEVIARHEILRTSFSTVDGQPVQIIAPTLQLSFPIVDLRSMPEAEREAEVSRLIKRDTRGPFDLTQVPLLRASLLRLGEEEHILVIALHHIVSDGWSMGILFREIATLYDAFSSGKPSPLPPLPIQYADFSVWQRQWLEGETLDKQLSYWKKQLGGLPPALDLPKDQSRPVVQTFRGAHQAAVLPAPLTEGIKKLGRREGTSLFMTLLAAFKILIGRLAGQNDIAVGTPIAGRNRAEIEPLIGFFINTLVLRTDLSGSPSFRQLLSRVRETALDAYAHQDLPFEKLVEELRPDRDLGRTPLFQVFFNTLNLEGEPFRLRGLKVERLAGSGADSKFDLTLYTREQHSEIHLRLVYNTDLFRPHRMAELLEQFKQLLFQIVENPDRGIEAISLVTPAARKILPDPVQRLAPEWSRPVYEQVAQNARRSPGATALVDRQSAWTYGQLNSLSNQLAHYLLEKGIRRGGVVAVYGHRSASLVWALLGILKAGAAFQILDPGYPSSRLIGYLRVSEPRGWLQVEGAESPSDDLKDLVQSSPYVCRLELPSSPTAPDLLVGCPTSDPELAVGPEDAAYVAFTSGSTGEPKAILGTHQPLSHFFDWHNQTFGLNDADRFSFLSGISHDPALRDIFSPLWIGATLCIPDPEQFGAPGYLVEWLQREQITVAHLTPAVSELLAEGARNPGFANGAATALRYAFFGGDALTRSDVTGFRQLFPSATCVNFYGATETPQAMGYFVVPRWEDLPNDHSKETIPLGRGIDGVQLLILNSARNLAGIGELGEVYVRTPYLARGYLGDQALTDQKFIANPFTKVGKDRLYKTGDRARYLPDGSVEFAGRADQQVKIRGFRIELGEIEAVLREYPAVHEAVVLARENSPANPSGQAQAGSSAPTKPDKQLVAYIVSAPDQTPTAGELRKHLRSKVPDYMIPSAFVFLEAFPLTPNGKVDRGRLPAPDPLSASLEETFVAPRTPVEEVWTNIWAEVLKIERVGVRDNFFDIGGHSLLATKVVARIREALDIDLPLRALFEKPTIAELAELTMQNLAKKAAPAEMGDFLAEIESLSDEETKRMLEEGLDPDGKP